MNATNKLIAALLLAAGTGIASANSGVVRELADQTATTQTFSTVTRAQVRAELLAARAAGELVEGPNGETARELNPARYPQADAPQGASRADIKLALRDARRTGFIAPGYYNN